MYRFTAACLVGALAVAACTDDRKVGAPIVLTARWCDTAETILPGGVTDSCESRIGREIFDPLAWLDPETGEVELVTAADISSDDLTTWTITIADGRTFHDGTPVTADSFVDAWNHVADPANGRPRADDLRFIAGYDDLAAGRADRLSGARAVDGTTIDVTLRQPLARFPELLGDPGFYPLAAATLQDPDGFDRTPIGNGPFRIPAGYVPQQPLRLERWGAYAGPFPAHVDAIEFIPYADAGSAYRDFIAGNLDLVNGIPESDARDARERFGDRYLVAPGSTLVFMAFPTYLPPYDDPDVRRAIALAFDAAQVVETLLGENNSPATSWASPLHPDHREGACTPCAFDPDAAVALATSAELELSTMVHAYPAIGSTPVDATNAIGNQIRATLGIDFTIEGLPPPDLFGRAFARELQGPMNAGMSPDDGPPRGLATYLAPMFRSDGGYNLSGYSNPEFDALIDQADRTADADRRRRLYQQAEDLIHRDVPAVPIAFATNLVLRSERVDIGTDNPSALRFRNVRAAG